MSKTVSVPTSILATILTGHFISSSEGESPSGHLEYLPRLSAEIPPSDAPDLTNLVLQVASAQLWIRTCLPELTKAVLATFPPTFFEQVAGDFEAIVSKLRLLVDAFGEQQLLPEHPNRRRECSVSSLP